MVGAGLEGAHSGPLIESNEFHAICCIQGLMIDAHGIKGS